MSHRRHIAFVITTLGGGGAEKALILLANFLVARGYQISVICLEWEPVAFDLDVRVQVHRLSSGRLPSMALRLAIVPFLAWRLKVLLAHLRPDATISFLVRPNLAHIMTRYLGNRQRIVICEQLATGPLYASQGLPGRLMLWLTRQLYPKADKLLVTSRGILEALQQSGVVVKESAILPNPVSLEECAPVGSDPDPGNLPTVVTMGRLCDQKDHETLLRAFALVLRRRPAQLLVLGEGPLRGATERLIGSLGLAAHVRLLGFQSAPFDRIRSSHLFVLSSIYEGFGNVVVEALACQVPVVSTDCPSGPAEILEDGKYGILVAMRDPEALAQAILAGLEYSAEDRQRIGRRNLARAADFDVSKIAPMWLQELGFPPALDGEFARPVAASRLSEPFAVAPPA